jgi:periplasmic divalent cation tolerance protein
LARSAIKAADMTDCIVVLVTVGSRDEAERIAVAVVTERLAACVNVVGPITSLYHWQGQVERGQELLLIIKTRATLFDRLEARVKSLHSYQNPEVIALPISAGTAAYLDWLRGET